MVPQAILFDLDDTIISFGSRRLLLIEVAQEFASYLGPISAEEAGNTLEDAFFVFWADESNHRTWRFRLLDARILIITDLFRSWRDRAPGLTDDVSRTFAERFHLFREGQARFFPQALETLDHLKRTGVKLALVTNGGAVLQREKVERFDLARRFDHVQIEGEVGFGKPEERAYLHAMEALGVGASNTWMVGDNLEWEVAAPQRLGIYSIWHDHLGKGLPPGSNVVPDRIIRSIAELI